jgi:hypothetical protein
MNAKEFTQGKNFSTSKGFIVGRTIITFSEADFGEAEFMDDKGQIEKRNQVTIKGETFNVPTSVMKKVQEAVELGGTGVEVNRQGTTKNDTKYVTYILDKDGKIMQAKT